MNRQDNIINFKKFKQFLGISGNRPGGSQRSNFAVDAELERNLQPETPVAQRCKALRELGDAVKANKLEDASIKKLWDLTKDLIVPNKPAEQRQTALIFYQKLIQGQFESLGLMRGHFFRVIQEHEVPEDTFHRLEILKTLTDNGKNIKDFEDIIGAFMVQWIQVIVEAGVTETYLEVLVNMIKYNAAHLENNDLVGIVQNACFLSCRIDDTRTVLQCLQVLDAALCCRGIPIETLPLCIVALCRTVNRENYCQTSWKIMKNLLGTNLGHAALLTMCKILNDELMYTDEALLRGAVFHINMGLWGSTVSKLPCSPSPVLMSFLHALGSKRIIVTYEVILSIQRLIKMNGNKLSEPSWDVICDILVAISKNISYYEETSSLPKDHIVQTSFHDTLNTVEAMLQQNEIAANPDRIYKLIEVVCEDRSEISCMHLINYASSKISATRPEWLLALYTFMERFYNMKNANIRIKALQSLIQIMDINRAAYEEEILERVVIPHFINVHLESDVLVRSAVGKLLIDFTWHCDSKRCLELLDIIEKLLNRPFDLYEHNKITLKADADIQDVVTIVDGLIDIFIVKLYRLPSSHAIKIYHLLIGHLEKYYQTPALLDYSSLIREKIFSWMLRARANATFHIGYPDTSNTNQIRFSHYLGIDQHHQHHAMSFQQTQSQQAQSTQSSGQSQQSSEVANVPTSTFSTISIRRGCKRIVECLQKEKDWFIIQLVLRELPNILQNKAILQGNDMDTLATTLIAMYMSKNSMDLFVPAANRPNFSDFHAMILPTIASLVPYHQVIGQHTQKNMIEALRSGLFSRNPQVCVHALTMMLLEMPEMMLRHLPDVLLEMSKMSTTVNVAVPVLEFLSTLIRLPSRRFANFVLVQYMYVFAISVPYTNPYKYDHYTVSLAHHVIAGWFLKCKVPLRRNFVNYIIKNFETNIQVPFHEIKKMDFSQINNEDSSNRKRSSSLTEQSSRHRDRTLQKIQQRPKQDDALYNFHMELAETCIDFLARHTFSPCSALPKRFPTVNSLLAGGQSQSWLVGHNIITITTSGCTSNQLRNGLCDRCSLLCKTPLPQKTSGNSSMCPTSPDTMSTRTDSSSVNKRYTKASLQHTSGQESSSTDITMSSMSSSAAPTPYHQSTDSGKFFRQASTDARFSSASGSLEFLSRRGSNPDTPDNNNDSFINTARSSQSISSNQQTSPQQQVIERSKQTCACSCTGWAEICVRRPTGNISWIMRVQNQISVDTPNEFPLHDLISLFMPTMGGVFGSDFLADNSFLNTSTLSPETNVDHQRKISVLSNELSDIKSQEDLKKDIEKFMPPKQKSVSPPSETVTTSSGPIDIPKQSQPKKELAGSFSDVEPEKDDENSDVPFEDDESRLRNPVRRVNSSPEMSSSWKNPFLGQKGPIGSGPGGGGGGSNGQEEECSNVEAEQQQKKKSFGKDMRVSCEAIPEEIAGSTPPSHPDSVKETEASLHPKVLLASATAVMAKPATLVPSSSFPTETTPDTKHSLETHSQSPPKKQLSADDALLPPKSDQPQTTKLKLPMDMPKVTTKPPHSPAPLSPRLLAKNAANKIASIQFAPSVSGGSNNGNGNDYHRGRSKTISVVREHDNRDNSKWTFRGSKLYEKSNQSESKTTKIPARSGLSPSSVFLQLYNTGPNSSVEHPIHIGSNNTKAIALLDLIPPFETHKIGVLYVGPGQCANETEIFKNRYGSFRYTQFLRNLGTLVSLKDAKEHNLFVNMDSTGKDGNFTYIWQDDIVQVTFHVATLMPNKEQDPLCHEKKKHIGNDFVTIVYNESGEEYNLNTIKGQFNYACVIVQPMELNSNRIFVRAKEDVSKYVGYSEPKIVSDSSAPLLARQLALHANLASLVSQSLKTKNQSPYASNWLERLRKIKHLRAKLLKDNISSTSDHSGSSSNNSTSSGIDSPWLKEDFTTYTQ